MVNIDIIFKIDIVIAIAFANRRRKAINHSLEINEPIYLYWCISQILGTNICWLTFLVESDRQRSDRG